MANTRSALIIGVGPGLGAALVHRFRHAGLTVTAAARDPGKLQSLFGNTPDVRLRACDATDAAAVEHLVAQTEGETGPLDLAIYNAGAYQRGGILDLTPEDLERCWRIGCFGGFIFGQAAAKRMATRGRGTILFTGATASLRGSAGFAALAIPKFGLRALAQSMARELQPRGVHVAHVVVDGQIGRTEAEGLEQLDPAAIADAYHALYSQKPRAWTLELDLRTGVERF